MSGAPIVTSLLQTEDFSLWRDLQAIQRDTHLKQLKGLFR